jgi:hypothetical protein
VGDKVLFLTTRITVAADGSIPFGPDDRVLTEDEVRALAAIYWPANEVQNAVDVSRCESIGFHTGAWNRKGEDSRGLWQINVAAGAHPQLAQYNLFDPQVNAYWAHNIWASSGWGPWTCAHLLHLV